jgi:hypothetical protein
MQGCRLQITRLKVDCSASINEILDNDVLVTQRRIMQGRNALRVQVICSSLSVVEQISNIVERATLSSFEKGYIWNVRSFSKTIDYLFQYRSGTNCGHYHEERRRALCARLDLIQLVQRRWLYCRIQTAKVACRDCPVQACQPKC